MTRFFMAVLTALLFAFGAHAQPSFSEGAPVQLTPPPGVPASGGTFTGPITFGGSGISTGLPTNGVYLNSKNQCSNASPAIGLSGKDGTPLLQFLSSAQSAEPPSDTIGLGYGALSAWVCTGTNGPEVALGTYALHAIVSGDHNIAIGNQSQAASTTGTHNTTIGIDSLATATAPTTTVAVGEHTLTFAPTVTNDVFVGVGDGFYLGTTNFDTAVGFQAMQGLVGNQGTGSISNNVAVGYNAMQNIGTSAADNTAVGSQALSSATFNATLDIAIGYQAGIGVTTGGGNIMIGTGAGAGITTGTANTFIGTAASFASAANSLGIICIGQSAICGGQDTVVGSYASAAMATNNSGTSAFGNYALYATTGVHNTAFGYTAGQNITTGQSNLVLGYAVESTPSLTGSNNVILGTSANCVLSGAAAANEFDLCGSSTTVLQITGMGTPGTSIMIVNGELVSGGGSQFSALNLTTGFFHFPFTNSTSGAGGIPTGTPATKDGDACVWNDVTFVLDCYSASASAWKHVAFSANAG